MLLLFWEEAWVSPESLFDGKVVEEGAARALMTRDRQRQQQKKYCPMEEHWPIVEFVQWFREQSILLVWIHHHQVERMAGKTTC